MNLLTFVFLLLASLFVLTTPRRWAAFPILLVGCYITQGQVILLGPFHFTALRIIIAFGIIRLILKRERPMGTITGLDWIIILWGIVALLVPPFHKDPYYTLINHLGRVYDILGVYFIFRSLFHNNEEVTNLIMFLCIILMPVALEMLFEQITHHNLFSYFGAVREIPALRQGHFRSQGPFRHAILAGTVGAVCLPLTVGIWKRHPATATLGAGACLLMVLVSFSSGPVLSLLYGMLALFLWRWRKYTKGMCVGVMMSYIALSLIMKDPPYYLLAKIDIAGGSTGWHRARLIESSIEHFSEWWLFGTDFTRHWMPTGVSWSLDHADITNHYIAMGILGGLPLLLVFTLSIWMGFKYVGQVIQISRNGKQQFLVWTLGSSLFSLSITFIGVSIFDQSIIFFYLVLAAISSIHTHTLTQQHYYTYSVLHIIDDIHNPNDLSLCLTPRILYRRDHYHSFGSISDL